MPATLRPACEPEVSARTKRAKPGSHRNAWRLIERRAEDFITPARAGKLASVIVDKGSSTEVAALSSPALLLPYLEARLAETLADPSSTGFNLGGSAAVERSPGIR